MEDSKTRIMNYLNDLAKEDNALAEKLSDTSIKNETKMMSYITGEAKKLCEKNQNSICIDDDTVYQWARHYWLDYEEKADKEVDPEDNDEEIEKPKVKNVKVVQDKNKETKDFEQMSLFDF